MRKARRAGRLSASCTPSWSASRWPRSAAGPPARRCRFRAPSPSGRALSARPPWLSRPAGGPQSGGPPGPRQPRGAGRPRPAGPGGPVPLPRSLDRPGQGPVHDVSQGRRLGDEARANAAVRFDRVGPSAQARASLRGHQSRQTSVCRRSGSGPATGLPQPRTMAAPSANPPRVPRRRPSAKRERHLSDCPEPGDRAACSLHIRGGRGVFRTGWVRRGRPSSPGPRATWLVEG